MKAMKVIGTRATRKSSRKVMTGASMPYLTRVMEAIMVMARLSAEPVKGLDIG
jgi:hypothetical protein